MAKIYYCAKKSGCMDISGDAQGACTAKKCGNVIKDSLKQTCYECYILMGGGRNFVEACAPDLTEHDNRFNSPGLLVLSKEPMMNLEYTPFWPGKRQTLERGYIQANVSGVGKTLCTHMTYKG